MDIRTEGVQAVLGGSAILKGVDIQVGQRELVGIIGPNGSGKSTLLKCIYRVLKPTGGAVLLDGRDLDQYSYRESARRIAVVAQHNYYNFEFSVQDVVMMGRAPHKRALDRDNADDFRLVAEALELVGMSGFARRSFSTLSGGEQQRVILARALAQQTPCLILDEPTNHLDMETAGWLEQYMKHYKNAVVMVSHDRYFLDQAADVVYELSGKVLRRYPGNYTHYREEKLKQIQLQKKAYERQQEELARLEGLVERFKHKPNKAAFARAKRKTMEHMERVEKPQEDDAHIFTGEINPLLPGSKWVFNSEHLKIGYERPLLEITMRIRRGQKIALLGPNGAGKTTFLKTIAGFLPSLEGSYSLGNQTTIGYFDQHSGAIQSEQTVLEHFTAQFPALTEKEARSILGAYLFGGRDAQKKVSTLSGGEKARLVLAELLQSRPNFLVLDEPTNHMDIRAKETLESAFCAYKGTILFVSHDRYFIRQVADAVMIFEHQSVVYYPFGYEHYLERKARENQNGSMAAQIKAEEQALIAGMRAVPKAERHRLREIPEDEAYREWNMRLAAERLEPAGNAVEYLTGQVRELKAMWQGSEAYWNGGVWDRMDEYENQCLRLKQAWEEWHRACMEWLDKAQEMEVL